MADKVIHVNVTATKSQKVNVSAGNVQNQITATPDSSQYYSNLAKNWAVGTGLILNEDYSSKHYANASKASAEQAKNYADATQETYNNVVDYSVEAMDNIEVTKNSAISDISESGHKAVTDIETEKQNTITEIQDITINNKEEIEKLSNQEQNKIVSLGIDTRANVDLSNLSATGEKHFLNKSQITNCITEIPQRIKLELNDGILTLKAGSTPIVPNNGVFEEVVVKSDVVNDLSSTTAQKAFLFYNSSSGKFKGWYAPNVYSGSGAPSSSQTGTLWYDSTNKQFYWKSDSTWLVLEDYSLPLGIGTWDGSKWTSIDQVFNGFGIIGSTVWNSKGIKGLHSYGFNDDGTLKNSEFVTSKVTTKQIDKNVYITLGSNGFGGSFIHYKEQEEEPTTTYTIWYNPKTNIMKWCSGTAKQWSDAVTLVPIYVQYANGRITSIETKKPFRAVDYNDFDKQKIVSWGLPDYSNAQTKSTNTQYTATQAGYVYAYGFTQSSAVKIIINDVTYEIGGRSDSYGGGASCFIPVDKNDTYKTTGNVSTVKFIPMKGAN